MENTFGITYRQYVNDRARRLRVEYPDSTAVERREVLKQCEVEWMGLVKSLTRDSVVSVTVGRSLVRLVGHGQASRLVRHVANFPECLPVCCQLPAAIDSSMVAL